MSQLLPSFQTIYRQGRFREHHVPESDETTEEGKRLMHQGERFTVACLAFVLHHDISFRADFLRRICGWEKADTAMEFAVLVELKDCGDLALEAPTLGVVFVLECKIGAGVQPHQHPDSPTFFNGGYGSGVLRRYPDGGAPLWQRTYITLTQELLTKKNEDSPKLHWLPKTWADLHKDLTPATTSGLVKDLFVTFAEHHIQCFADWNMKTQNLKLASHYFLACQISQLLEDTASLVKTRFGLNEARNDDHGLETAKDSYIGRALVCKNAPSEWLSFAGQKNSDGKEHLGWFGYAWGCVHVGFYCSGSATETAVQTLQQIKKPGEQVSEKDDNGYVWIFTPDNPAAGDQEWIISVFDRLHRSMEQLRSTP